MRDQAVKTTLLLPIHDPRGVDVERFRMVANFLDGIYEERFATVSDQTAGRWIEELEKHQYRIRIIPKKGAAYARRELVKFGLTGSLEYFHYGDYDRILTWALRYPDELMRTVKEIRQYDYTIIGRTERAFLSHPVAWVETERITNRVFGLEFGEEADICGGSCAFSRRGAEMLAQFSSPERAAMNDAERPMIIHRMTAFTVGVMAVEGLEYQEEINAVRREISPAEEWVARIRLCYEISKSAMNVGKEALEKQ